MNAVSWIILLLLIVVISLAIRGTIKRKKNGGCSCGSSGCSGNCASCGGCGK